MKSAFLPCASLFLFFLARRQITIAMHGGMELRVHHGRTGGHITKTSSDVGASGLQRDTVIGRAWSPFAHSR
jgi:hypothetical protein